MKLVVEFNGDEYVGETANVTYRQYAEYRDKLQAAAGSGAMAQEATVFENWHVLLRPEFRCSGEQVAFDDLPFQVALHFLTEAGSFLRRPLPNNELPT